MRTSISRTSSVVYKRCFPHRVIRLRHFSGLVQRPKAGHYDQLRILFCGADTFSVYSLRALNDYLHSPGSHIDSIDVVTKTDKRTGRGLKHVSSTEVKKAALELGLPVHQLDTFTGWSPPSYDFHPRPYINLVVAVSFGLLVPPRILKGCQYGGLNVHPSMLPKYRGAAPIQWQIIQDETQTGISIQTLHPSKFDEGIVLDQTPQPGLPIPNRDTITSLDLRDFLGPMGAEMLVKAIKNRLYIPPYTSVVQKVSAEITGIQRWAPKITNSSRGIDFTKHDVRKVLRMNRAIPKLWANATVHGKSPSVIRVIFGSDMHRGISAMFPHGINAESSTLPPGLPYAILPDNEDAFLSSAALWVKTRDEMLAIPTLTVAGSRPGPAVAAAMRAGLLKKLSNSDGHTLYAFHKPLLLPDPDVLETRVTDQDVSTSLAKQSSANLSPSSSLLDNQAGV